MERLGLKETPALPSVIKEIAAERTRQVSEEGWTFKHDDQHEDAELAMAAAIYASPNPNLKLDGRDPWPWWNEDDEQRAWWKPKSRRRDLIRAAALIVAEIERLDRLELKEKKDG